MTRDNDSDRNGEDKRSLAEGEASQSGGNAASPNLGLSSPTPALTGIEGKREAIAQIIARASGGSLNPGLGVPDDYPVSRYDHAAADAILATLSDTVGPAPDPKVEGVVEIVRRAVEDYEKRGKVGSVGIWLFPRHWRILLNALDHVGPAPASEVERLRNVEETFLYLCKWVERGLFCQHTAPKTALEAVAYYPGAPWNQGRWDVDHKPYADAFYKAFPRARQALETTGVSIQDDPDALTGCADDQTWADVSADDLRLFPQDGRVEG